MNGDSNPQPSRRSLLSLDVLNAVLADVQAGVGPFLAVYLTASRDWSPADVGVALTTGSIVSVASQTPVCAFIDSLRQKRTLVALAALLIGIASVMIVLVPGFFVVIGAQVLLGLVGPAIGPAVAGISLGLVGNRLLDRRMGRNQTFNHIGNVGVAALAGLLGSVAGDQ